MGNGETDLLATQPVLGDVGLVVLDGDVVTHAQHTQQVQVAVVLGKHKVIIVSMTLNADGSNVCSRLSKYSSVVMYFRT